MNNQYLRKASLTVGQATGNAIDLSSLRFSFSIRRGDIETPNSANVRVYNPSPKTVAALLERGSSLEFTQIAIQAGYEGSLGLIFQGTIKQVRYGRENQTDTYLDITAADGDSAYNYSTIALSLAAGQTQPVNVTQAVIGNMARANNGGIIAGDVPQSLTGNALPRGKVLYGMSRDEIRKVAANAGCSWSIQDGELTMIPLTGYLPGEAVLINRQTGMIGLPEVTQNGIAVKTLLNPRIKIGHAIQLKDIDISDPRKDAIVNIQQPRYGLSYKDQPYNNAAQNYEARINPQGFYYVMQANHTGDTRGQAWYTDLICISIDVTLPGMTVPNTTTTNNVGSIERNG